MPPALVDADDLPKLRRALGVFFSALFSAAALFLLAAQISPGIDAAGWSLGLLRFLLGAGALAAAVATWAAAVHMASVYRVAWPLGLTTAVVVAAVAFAAIRWLGSR